MTTSSTTLLLRARLDRVLRAGALIAGIGCGMDRCAAQPPEFWAPQAPNYVAAPSVAPAELDPAPVGAPPAWQTPPVPVDPFASAAPNRYAGIPVAAELPFAAAPPAIPHPAFIAAEPQPFVADALVEPDLAARLQAAEKRIRQLEARESANEVADEQQARMLDTLKERWDKVRDPSITTVDQQTYDAKSKKPSEKKWYDRLSIRGYTQMRLNETMNTAPGSAPPQYVGDRSIGDDQQFLLRRVRLIISGDVSDHMYVYMQPDFAVTPPGSPDNTYFAQIRDWYADLYLDECKVNRLRVGQSKVPYGWENMQSSSNRLALDRADPLNSAVRNERDLGVFYYWTPQPAQDFFKFVLDEGLKGSGNYGVLGLGVYNGQGGSLLEQNDQAHFVARLTVPYQFASGQCMEVGVQGYIGQYATFGSQISPLGVGALATPAGTLNSTVVERGNRDERVAATFVWYPQPIGFQTEWNVGRGPGLNEAQTIVEDRHLYGGYVQTMAKIDTPCHGTFFPFIRWSMFHGGYKPERNSPFSHIEETEFGTEWQINPQMEFTTTVLLTDRTNTNSIATAGVESYRQFEGEVMRFQFQFNY